MALDREQEIRERAYRRWEQEGCPEGQADDHWRQAERELDGEESGAAAAENGAVAGESAPAEASPRAARRPRRSAKQATDSGGRAAPR